MKIRNMKIRGLVASALSLVALLGAPVQAHHSFAMYDMQNVKVFTGVVTRIDPAPNHMGIFFAPMNEDRTNVLRDEDGSPIVWAVEMQGSAQMARRGVSVNTFPPGTVFSIGMHALRNGEPAGAREGGMFQCPGRTPPAAGMHCDSVEGHTAFGEDGLPEPSEP